MALDPASGFPLEQAAATAAKIAELERRLRKQEQGLERVQVGSGAPTADPTTLREGTPYIDRTALRHYYVVAGVWRYVTLT